MRVLFVNPPVVRSKNSSPENDFELDGIPYFSLLPPVGRLHQLWNRIGLGGSIRFGVRAGSRWPWTRETPLGASPNYPFFMGYAASSVKEAGHEVDIIDSVALSQHNYKKFLKQVTDWKPDLIIQECSTPTIDIDLWLAEKLSEIADLAISGPHISTPQIVADIQEQHPNIKYILCGEYINSAVELVNTLRPGVYEADVVKDVDTIPFPYRNYSAADQYFDPSMPTARPQLQVYGSKGCPFKCTFCSWPQTMYQRKVALRKPEKIAQEIREAIELHGYKSIFFDDDTFNMSHKRISELCDHLKEIGIPWTMMGRLDASPIWLFDKMVESGCVGMRFGVETFDLEVLAGVKKGIERKDFRGTLDHLCKTHPDLMLHITMMKDMPNQTEAIHKEDMDIIHGMGFARDNMMRSYQLSRCAPFPGTELYEQLKGDEAQVIELQDYKKYDGGQDTVMSDINDK